MSKTLDILEKATHGSPAGYVTGCRSGGGCPNHGERGQLTCLQAYRAWNHYFTLQVRDPEVPITRADLHTAKRGR